MPSTRQIFLPTEIIVQIIYFVAADGSRCQSTLHASCLISHQWYSAAISFLYEVPQLNSGSAFKQFTDTICPPIRARKSKLNLGSLVRRLDLSALVHHSTNSLTARLIGRVRENLEVFIAPKVSFSGNSLPALSKCLNLRYLDLSLVGEPIPFFNLEKALRHLQKLTTLRLPRHTIISPQTSKFAASVSTCTSIKLPASLRRIQMSGAFSPSTVSSFPWPPLLASLTLKNCDDLSVNCLVTLISNPQLGMTLKRLTISSFNRHLQPESINAIPAFLPGLAFLRVPGDLVKETFFDILAYMVEPLSLRTLELGYPYDNGRLEFSTDSLLRALSGGLSKLQSLGFAEVFVTEQRILEDEEVDIVLQKHAEKEHDPGVGIDEDVGIYYL